MDNGNLGISQKSSLTSDYIIDQPSNNSTKSIPRFPEQLAKPGQSMSSNLKKSIRKVKYSIGYLFSSKTERCKKLKECIDSFKGNITNKEINEVLGSLRCGSSGKDALILSNKIDVRQKLDILNTTYSKLGLHPKLDDFLSSCGGSKEVITALFLFDGFNTEDRLYILNKFNGYIPNDQINEILNLSSESNNKEPIRDLLMSNKVSTDQKMSILSQIYPKGVDGYTFEKLTKDYECGSMLTKALLFSEVVTVDQKIGLLRLEFKDGITNEQVEKFLTDKRCTNEAVVALILRKKVPVDKILNREFPENISKDTVINLLGKHYNTSKNDLRFSKEVTMEQKVDILNQVASNGISNTQINEILNSESCSSETFNVLLNGKKVTAEQKECINFIRDIRAGKSITEAVKTNFKGDLSDNQIDFILKSKDCAKDVQKVLINSDKVKMYQKVNILERTYSKTLTDAQINQFLTDSSWTNDAKKALFFCKLCPIAQKENVLNRIFAGSISNNELSQLCNYGGYATMLTLGRMKFVTAEQKTCINFLCDIIPGGRVIRSGYNGEEMFCKDMLNKHFSKNLSNNQLELILNSRYYTQGVQKVLINSDKVTKEQKQMI